jgi:hypothetical protein
MANLLNKTTVVDYWFDTCLSNLISISFTIRFDKNKYIPTKGKRSVNFRKNLLFEPSPKYND